MRWAFAGPMQRKLPWLSTLTVSLNWRAIVRTVYVQEVF